MKKKLYSYLRWSSAVQKEGTTLDRQSSGARAYAEENGYEYLEIQDDGVSAFKGVNATRGALAAFIRAVEDGFIPHNSTLYVESLDRISRDKVLKAVGLFSDLLELGITVITGSDKKIYTSESINQNSMDLLQSILLFSRAHEESKTKQMRTNGNALALIERFNRGESVTIKSVGSHPWWIDVTTRSDEQVRMHPTFWPIAQFAIEKFLEGLSVFKVTQMLNDKYYHAYKGKAWTYANVRKLRINKAVYGLREITVADRAYKLPGYYPALINEGQYLRLQQIRETTKYIGKVGEEVNNINLLSGMRIFRCGHCNGTMMAMRHNDTIRYLCEKGRGYANDCKTWSLPGILVEHTLMLVTTIAYIDIQRNGIGQKEDYTLQISNVEMLIEDIGTRISRGTTLALNGLGNIDEVMKQLQELEKERQNLTIQLEVLQRKQLLSDDNTFESLMMDFFKYAQYPVLKDPVHEYRSKLRDIVYSAIGEVKAWKVDRRLMISFQIKGHEDYYTFSAGDERYNYIFYYGSPAVLGEKAEGYELPDEIKVRIRQQSGYFAASMAVLETARTLLEVINYPELSGKLFWPKK